MVLGSVLNRKIGLCIPIAEKAINRLVIRLADYTWVNNSIGKVKQYILFGQVVEHYFRNL